MRSVWQFQLPQMQGGASTCSKLGPLHPMNWFIQMRDEKVHADVARSTFPSQNVQNTPLSDHFWKLRCRKSARRCGAKHISMSKCIKHTSFRPLLEVAMSKKCTLLWREAHFEVKMYKTHQLRPLLEVAMSKKCTPLWREAHFEVKMYKTPHVRATFGDSDLEKVHAVVARSTFRSQNVQNTTCWRHFWRFRCRFASLHYITLHYTPLHYTPLHYVTQLHNYTPLHSTTLNNATLHYIALHYTPLHYTTLRYLPLHFTTLHYTTLQLQLHNYTPLQNTPLH